MGRAQEGARASVIARRSGTKTPTRARPKAYPSGHTHRSTSVATSDLPQQEESNQTRAARAELERQIRAIVAELGGLPSCVQARALGYAKLAGYIGQNGGSVVVAREFNVESISSRARLERYWSDQRIGQELLAAAANSDGYFPKVSQLRREGKRGLASAVSKYGGALEWSRKLGLELRPESRKVLGVFANELSPEMIQQAKSCVAEVGHLPSEVAVLRKGYRELGLYLQRNRNSREVAARLGLPPMPPRRKWNQEVLEQELRDFIGDSGLLPLKQEMRDAGRGDLVAIVRKSDLSLTEWAEKLEVSLRPRQKLGSRSLLCSRETAISEAGSCIAQHGKIFGSTKLRKMRFVQLATYMQSSARRGISEADARADLELGMRLESRQ